MSNLLQHARHWLGRHRAGEPASELHLLIGTYTRGESLGLYRYRFDSGSGEIAGPLEVTRLSNPSQLTLSPDGRHLFVVSEDGQEDDERSGTVSSYRVDPATGRLAPLSRVSSAGECPTFSSLSPGGRFLFVANYGGHGAGSLAVLPVLADGRLGQALQVEAGHPPSGVISGRQETGHAHAAVMEPGGEYLFVPDLGADQIRVYRFDRKHDQPLRPAASPAIDSPLGSGPRHLVFSSDSLYAYLTLELSGHVAVWAHNGDGLLVLLQACQLTPDGFSGEVSAGALHLSDDQRFLHVLSRGDDNQLVTFAVDDGTGSLQLLERRSVQGRAPREFTLSPDGRFLLIANQDSHQVCVFARDPRSGRLGDCLQEVPIDSPADLCFLPLASVSQD